MRPSTITNHEVPSIGSQFVIRAGETLNSMIAKPIAIAKAKMSCVRVSSVCTGLPSSPTSSPSGAAYCAEMASALKPIASDSPRATTPRMIGARSQR